MNTLPLKREGYSFLIDENNMYFDFIINLYNIEYFLTININY